MAGTGPSGMTAWNSPTPWEGTRHGVDLSRGGSVDVQRGTLDRAQVLRVDLGDIGSRWTAMPPRVSGTARRWTSSTAVARRGWSAGLALRRRTARPRQRPPRACIRDRHALPDALRSEEAPSPEETIEVPA